MATDLEPEQNEESYCWPWFGVIVNVQRNNAGNCDYWLNEFSEYHPSGIEMIAGQVVVLSFGNDWTGFKNATEFDKSFKDQGCSKKEWIERRTSPGSSIYGWFARGDEYKSEGRLGDYLRRKGVALKTISDLVRETAEDRENIVSNLVNENLDQVHIKYNEKTLSVKRALEEKKGQVHHNFCEGMEAERDDTNFPPQATVGPIPNVGQEFQSLEDALDFYNQYAKQAGFSTRIGNNRKNKKTGEEVWKLFVCSKEGKTDETWQNKLKYAVERSGERNRVHTRCGCRARMSIVKSRDRNVWSVSKFVAEHNHVLATPGKVRPLSSHRNVSTTKKALTQQMAEANILTCQQVQLLEIDAGGPSFIGCLESDIRNYERDIRNELLGDDAETLIQH